MHAVYPRGCLLVLSNAHILMSQAFAHVAHPLTEPCYQQGLFS